MSDLLALTPPQNLEAERAVLGACLLEPVAVDLVAEELVPEDFYNARHGAIYRTLLTLRERGSAIDALTVATELRDRKQLDAVGGPQEIAELLGAVPTSANATYYSRLVLDASRLRRAIMATAAAQRDLWESREPVDVRLDGLERAIFEATSDRHTKTRRVDLGDQLREVFDAIERRRRGEAVGIPYGYSALDDLTLGLRPGDLTVIAARPGMGKTTMAINVVRNILDDRQRASDAARHGVAFFSLEMPESEVIHNLLCSLERVDTHVARSGRLGDDQLNSLYAAAEVVGNWNLHVESPASLTVTQLRAKARRLRAEKRLDAIVVDYLQLMTGGRDGDARHEIVADITRGLKSLATELSVPIVALAQLNRNVEDRPDHRPRMSDLRESGATEQDAAVVLLLHREGYYMDPQKERDEHKDTQATLIVAKNRYGPTGDVPLFYKREWAMFGEAEYGPTGARS